MNKNLFLIHGAWCTKNSFNYIVKKILDDSPVGNIHCFEYDCQKEDINDTLLRASSELQKLSSNGLETVIVGHSLGGVLALKLSQKNCVYKTFTLAAPLSGLKSINMIAHYYMSYTTPVIKHLTANSKFMLELHSRDYSKNPVECLIACSGHNPMIVEPSDGVVSISSQMSWTPPGASIYKVETNHSEILLAPQTILRIERALESKEI